MHRDAVIVGLLSVFMFQAGTVLTVNLLRGGVPGSVQCDEDRVMDGPEAFDNAVLAQGFVSRVINGEERFGGNRIERLANVVVGGDLLDGKKTVRIVPSFGLLHGPLKGEEGRRLGKEDREGAGADVLHGVLGVVAGAAIRQRAQDLAQMADEAMPRLDTHEASLRCPSALSGFRYTSLMGTFKVKAASLRLRPVVAPTRNHPAAR